MPTFCSSKPRRTAAAGRLLGWVLGAALAALSGHGAAQTIEPRHRLHLASHPALPAGAIALTLDACGGAFDAELINTLVALKVPATVFTTAKWLRANPEGLRRLQAHPELFELENHGAAHLPAVVGGQLYGMHGPADLPGVEREISGGIAAITATGAPAPRWYRGAGARYDAESLKLIERLQLRVAGYSVNADDGATANAATVARRLRSAQAGDIILAHMNKPVGGTAEGLQQALPEMLQRGLKFVRLSQAGALLDMPPAAARR